MAKGQVIDVPLAGGLREGDDKRLTAGLLQLRNGLYRKNGSVQKRYGITCLSTTSPILDAAVGVPFAQATMPVPEECAAFEGGLVRVGGGDLYTYSAATAQYAWGGSPSNVTVREDFAPSQAAGGVTSATACLVGSYLVYVYTARVMNTASNVMVYADVFDLQSNAVVCQGRALGSTTLANAFYDYPVVVNLGGVARIAVFNLIGGVTPSVELFSFTPSTLARGASNGVSVAAGSATGHRYDLATDGTNLFLGVVLSTSQPRILKMTSTFSTTATAVSSSTTAAGAVSLVLTGGVAALSYGTSTGINCLTAPTSTLAAPVDTVMTTYSGGTVLSTISLSATSLVWFDGTVSGAFNPATNTVIDTFAAIAMDVAGTVQPYVRLESRLFSVQLPGQTARVFALASNARGLSTTNSQAPIGNTKFLVELYTNGTTTAFRTLRVRAAMRPQTSYATVFGGAAAVLPSGDVVCPAIVGGVVQTTGTAYTTSALFTFAFKNRSVQSVVANGQLLIAGGLVTAFDGSLATEVGFSHVPDSTTGGTPTTGGLMTVSTSYTYAFTFGYQDATGAIWEGAPNFSSAVALSASQNAVSLLYPTLSLSHKPVAAGAKNFGGAQTSWTNVYRNTASAPATFYLVDRVAGQAYTDVTSDAALSVRQTLYTQGGVVDNVAPPASHVIAVSQQRVWLAAEDGTIWFSKLFVAGQPVNFSDSFVMQPFEGGPVTAIAALDTNTIVFKAGGVYVISGDGPSDSLVGAFSPPRLVQSALGCVDPKSVVRIAQGLLYRSSMGVVLLTRDLSTQLIGNPAEDTLGPYGGTCVGALYLPSSGLVRFALQNSYSTTASGTTQNHALNWDADTAVFSVDTYGLRLGAAGSTVLCACLWQGRWTLFAGDALTTTPVVGLYAESPNSFFDYYSAPSYVPTVVQTSHLKMSGLQGYQRLWKVGVLGALVDTCDLTVTILTDYADTTAQLPLAQSRTFTNAVLAGARRAQVQLDVVNQQCEAVSIIVSDAQAAAGAPTVSWGGFTLQGIALEIGAKTGMRPLSAAQKG